MTTCKEEATRWVYRYAIGGAAFAALPLPIPTSAGLATLETHMLGVIGSIYGEQSTPLATAAAGGTFAVMGQGLKYVAMQVAGFVPGFGSAIRMGIAGATVVSIGMALVGHFERKYPGKLFVSGAGESIQSEAPKS